MSDIFNLPSDFRGDIKYYFGPPAFTTNSTRLATWHKPRRGYTMAYIICIGSGAGGGGGFSAAAGNARGGGGGGASGNVARGIFPLNLLPDALTIGVGGGGIGGAAGNAGQDGAVSLVCCASIKSLIVDNTIIRSSNGQANGGGGGTGAGGGVGGASGAVAGISHGGFSALGIFTSGLSSIVGNAGGAGGAQTGANGTSVPIPVTGNLLTGGAGGAGVTAVDFSGGGHTAIANSWLSEQRAAQPATGSVNGSGGFTIWKPFFSFGGQGGSSSDAGVGGHGGNAHIGSGGGGGGGGTTGGRGGDGGTGLVIVICW